MYTWARNGDMAVVTHGDSISQGEEQFLPGGGITGTRHVSSFHSRNSTDRGSQSRRDQSTRSRVRFLALGKVLVTPIPNTPVPPFARARLYRCVANVVYKMLTPSRRRWNVKTKGQGRGGDSHQTARRHGHFMAPVVTPDPGRMTSTARVIPLAPGGESNWRGREGGEGSNR